MCGPCGDALGCEVAMGCQSGVCDRGLCAIPLCDDGAKNGDETDVDCAGEHCDPCEDGLACEVDAAATDWKFTKNAGGGERAAIPGRAGAVRGSRGRQASGPRGSRRGGPHARPLVASGSG